MSKTRTMLISFIHPIGLMVDGRAILVSCCICEELFQGAVEVTPKIKAEQAVGEVQRMPLDFPLFVNVLSLADGKELKERNRVIVKWNNISAIVELENE